MVSASADPAPPVRGTPAATSAAPTGAFIGEDHRSIGMDAPRRAFLDDLLTTPSPSGFETDGQRVWADYVRQFADDVWTDAYGNTVAVHEGDGDGRARPVQDGVGPPRPQVLAVGPGVPRRPRRESGVQLEDDRERDQQGRDGRRGHRDRFDVLGDPRRVDVPGDLRRVDLHSDGAPHRPLTTT